MWQKLARLAFTIYRCFLSPAIHIIAGPLWGCRFVPTCSEYSYTAMKRYGLYSGFVMSLKRLSSCHPFSKPGYDPVPDHIICGRQKPLKSNPNQGR